jgi:hypothetical protein
MQRDLDLARQLLLDIENRGADCSVSVLRPGTNHQSQDKVRYHLRLLIDAQLLKEIDRTSSGIPCVRLTHQGHELLELVRSDARWGEAKQACHDRLGGLSLSVIRGILLRWAVAGAGSAVRYYRVPVGRRHELPMTRERATYRVEPYTDRLVEQPYWDEPSAHYAPAEQNGHAGGMELGLDLDGDGQVDVPLPGYLI